MNEYITMKTYVSSKIGGFSRYNIKSAHISVHSDLMVAIPIFVFTDFQYRGQRAENYY